MTKDELEAIAILDWNDLRPKYKNPDLLIGNGFSINLSPNFRYKSLFETFIKNTKSPYTELFSNFDTTNFELILRELQSAVKVNTILTLPVDTINNAIIELKNGLIAAIKEVHPRVSDIDWNRIENLTVELEDFGNVFSTNYDLYLYHIIMKSIDISRSKKGFIAHQDYFWGNATAGFKAFMPFQNYQYKHIYYLHGALCIFNHGIIDLKLTRNNSSTELIDIISNEIQQNRFPLFITEGSGRDKVAAIYRSNYLHFCLQKLKERTLNPTPIIVYGNSLSDFDAHIVDALKTSGREIIVSIYTMGRDAVDLQKEKFTIMEEFKTHKPSIKFIDSSTLLQG